MKVSSSPPDLNIKMTNLLKIESFINDSSYSELIDHSANFNARITLERKQRLPFLDPQTGVAQKHSNLYFKKSQRLPGLRGGQLYTYPSTRWRSSKRSLMKYSSHPFYRFKAADNFPSLLNSNNHNTTSSTTVTNTTAAVIAENSGESSELLQLDESNSLAGDTDSKDSQNIKEDSMILSKDWYYDDMMDSNDLGSEEQGDSDFEYSMNGYKRKKKAPTTRKSTSNRKPKESDGGVKKSRSSSSATGGGGSRSNRSRKSSSRSSKKSNEKKNIEPPSFDSVQGDYLMDGSADSFGSFRNF
jgi:zinc finger protein ubi-d4